MLNDVLPHGFTVFCDDVRTEDNGKQILIGVYGNDMVVGQFPHSQPLCGLTTLIIPAAMKLSNNVFRLYQNADLIFELAAKGDQIEAKRAQIHAATDEVPWPGQDVLPPDEDRVKIGAIKIGFRIDPANFDGPCALRARWDIGSQVIRAGSLMVVSRNDVEQRKQALILAAEKTLLKSSQTKRSARRRST